MTRVDDLLAGPRGRGLCAALAWSAGDVFAALRRSVDNAAYWQAPLDADEIDRPDEQFRPLADAVVHSAEIAWWRAPLALDEQHYVDLLHRADTPRPPKLSGTAAALDRWQRSELRSRSTARDLDEDDDVSGVWWSAPIRRGVVSTTRILPGRGPVGLWLVEDELGWPRARSWPVRTVSAPRVFEVHGPGDWARLAATYPLDVTAARAPDWKRATGRSGRWVVPDWPAVAVDFDAVHVSVWGYLTTAGRPVRVNGQSASLLAGWAPDATYWLADCLRLAGAPVDYTVDDDGAWHRAGPAARN